jgi:hypothetical protein
VVILDTVPEVSILPLGHSSQINCSYQTSLTPIPSKDWELGFEEFHKQYPNSTLLEWKGYSFEGYVYSTLDGLQVSYSHNPRSFQDWKRFQSGLGQNHPPDLEVYGKRIELKRNDRRVFPSWVKRDWNLSNCDILVTSNRAKISKAGRRYIEKVLGVKVWNLRYFLEWVKWKIFRSKPVRAVLNQSILKNLRKLNFLSSYEFLEKMDEDAEGSKQVPLTVYVGFGGGDLKSYDEAFRRLENYAASFMKTKVDSYEACNSWGW